MSPSRLRQILDALRWSQRDLADLVACNERLARRWAAGQADVPEAIADWLETRLQLHVQSPPPDWKRRSAA